MVIVEITEWIATIAKIKVVISLETIEEVIKQGTVEEVIRLENQELVIILAKTGVTSNTIKSKGGPSESK